MRYGTTASGSVDLRWYSRKAIPPVVQACRWIAGGLRTVMDDIGSLVGSTHGPLCNFYRRRAWNQCPRRRACVFVVLWAECHVARIRDHHRVAVKSEWWQICHQKYSARGTKNFLL